MSESLDSQITLGDVSPARPLYTFPKDPKLKVLVNVRRGINRDLVKRLLQSQKYTYEQISAYVGCTARHIRRIRDELIENGNLTLEESKKGMGIVAAEFDEECIRSTGERFSTYIKNKRKRWKQVFAFCRRTWKHVWKEPSIFLMTDRTDSLGAELCQKFIETFGNNKTRIRDYKKHIRPFLVFIGRDDLNRKYMSMSKTQDPEAIREIPQIEFMDFPLKLDRAISAFQEVHGVPKVTKLKFKIISGLRTGDFKEERGWMGLRTTPDFKSYIVFDGPDQFRCSVFEKMSEQWRITWIPKNIRHILYDMWKDTPQGEPLIERHPVTIRKRWYEISEPILGFRLTLHDFRKVFATWLIIMGVPFHKTAKLNVGWADLNTLDRNYNQVSSAMKKSDVEKYRANIPEWFKEELEEYIE